MGEFLEQAGPVSYLLLFFGFFGLLTVLERFFAYQRMHINPADLLVGLNSHLRKKALAEARHEAARAPGPIGRVCHAVLMRPDLSMADLRQVAQDAGRLEIPRIEKNLRSLLTVAMVAPLLGMLGTVVGLTGTFLKIRDSAAITTTSELSGGIFQALLTTALGLTIAIPMYLFYLYFYGRASSLLHKIEGAGVEIVNLVVDAQKDGEILSITEARQEEKRSGK